MAVYPNLPEQFELKMAAIKIAAEGVEEGEGGIDAWLEGSPYRHNERLILRAMLGRGKGADAGGDADDYEKAQNPFKAKGVETDLDRFDLLLDEVEVTIGEMRNLEKAMRNSEDPSDRIAVMRAKTVLLEKWANLKSSVFTMREIAEFQQLVIDTLDKVLTVDQRNEFMNKLKKL